MKENKIKNATAQKDTNTFILYLVSLYMFTASRGSSVPGAASCFLYCPIQFSSLKSIFIARALCHAEFPVKNAEMVK